MSNVEQEATPVAAAATAEAQSEAAPTNAPAAPAKAAVPAAAVDGQAPEAPVEAESSEAAPEAAEAEAAEAWSFCWSLQTNLVVLKLPTNNQKSHVQSRSVHFVIFQSRKYLFWFFCWQ